MRTSLSQLAVLSLLGAIAAWGLVGYVATKTGDDRAALNARFEEISRGSSQRDAAIRLRALALSSAQERAALDQVVPSDISTIVAAIDATGKNSKAAVQIGTAAPVELPASAPSGLHAVEFVVQASGSFSDVLQSAYLFSELPIPARVTEIDFEQLPSTGSSRAKAPWQLTLRLQVLTTAAISS